MHSQRAMVLAALLAEHGTAAHNAYPMRRYPPPKTGPHTGWSPDRDRTAQAKFRRLVLKRDHHTCRRCGYHDPTGRALEAHHLQAGYDPSVGITLCTTQANGCHRTQDPHAR